MAKIPVLGWEISCGSSLNADSAGRLADRIILMAGDADCIPAARHAQKAGLQVVLVEFPNAPLDPALKQQADYVRKVPWP